MDSTDSIEKIAFRYGMLTLAGLLVYFFLMKFIGLIQVHELRALNLLILIGGISLALKKYREVSQTAPIYFQGLGLGILVSVFAVIPFGVFIFFYLVMDHQFLLYLQEHEAFGQYLNPYILSFLVAFEGIASGAMVSFGLMQYYKKSHITTSS